MTDPLLDFPRFLELVRGHEPFAWQAELADRLRTGDLPPLLDVPTGLGKTSLIDCWAYALTNSAAKGPGVPLRLCFVVDRRLIVDAAFDHARELECALARALADGGPLAATARALSARSGGGSPLTCVRMRGGASWEGRWLARPDQPAIVVGTVDQFGSRLLFRGYGASDRMRPLDAALVGTDSWLVIDEAHIAAPLVQTAQRVARLQETARQRVTRPLAVTEMTATPAGSPPAGALRADPRQQVDESRFPGAAAAARRRLEASKPVALVELPAVKPAATPRGRAGALGAMLGKLALRVDRQAQLVGVLCNTIAAARAAHGELTDAGAEATLLIGRCREYEREAILDEWLPLIELGAERDGQRRYVVATQTIEVGANLDLDAAVCELPSLAALVQRFGRVNRSGERRPSVSVVAHCAAQHESDPVYGPAAEATWRHLVERCGASPLVLTAKMLGSLDLGRAQLDLGPANTRELVAGAPSEVSPEPGYVPVLLGSEVERWAATSPAPEPDQAVGPFLRGVVASAPEVYVAWRAAPPLAPQDVDAWRDWLATARPVESEFVAVPIWEARALLGGTAAALPLSDQEGAAAATEEEEEAPLDHEPNGELIGVALTDDPAELAPVRVPGDVRVGGRLVLRSDAGGHDRWGWTGVRAGGGEVVPDVGDLAPGRRRGVLRLDQHVLAALLPAERRAELQEKLAGIDAEDPDSVARFLLELTELAAGVPRLRALTERAIAEHWRLDRTPWSAADVGEPPPTLRAPAGRDAALEATSDADEASSSQAGAAQPLAAHLHAVAELAREFAAHLQLEDGLSRAVERAALWHDLGKAEPRFQTMLHDGDELAAQLAEEPLAKSGRDPADPVARTAARIAGVPPGFRHEAASARLFERLAAERPDLLDGLDVELVHHLIASHHGTARPLFPPLVDRDPRPVSVTAPAGADAPPVAVEITGRERQVDWAHPKRFESLCERYGWWGLALLETIVRLADMLASEKGGQGVPERELVEAAGPAR